MKAFKFRLMTICKSRQTFASPDIEAFQRLQAIKRKARKYEVMRHTAGARSAFTTGQQCGYEFWFMMECVSIDAFDMAQPLTLP